VGVIYASLGVRSPAPPIIALLGLLGMLGGEQAVEYIKSKRAQANPPAAVQPLEASKKDGS
jgi:XapX domain-containing protein